MGTSNLPNRDEIKIQMQKRIAELEKVNKELRAENIALKQDITTYKRSGEALCQDKQRVKLKLEDNLSPPKKVENLELAEIIDVQEVQSLMDDFYKLTHIPIGIIDLKGNVLVGVGWQDICTKFHRVHPETCTYCVESDTKLSKGVSSGEFKLYKCKNNMWDIATPIIVGGQHVGNIFLGQFLFEGESLDYELFKLQARKYGFNEKGYISALEKVPRFSPMAVDKIMTFFMKLANMFSKLSYSNVKLAQSLAERDALVEALQDSERRERARSEELEAVLDAVPVAVFIAHDSQALEINGNRISYEWLRVPVGTNFSKSAPEGERPEMFKLFKDGREIPPEKMPSQMAAAGREVNECELDIVSADGNIRHILGNARPLRDEKGNLRGSVSAFIDITERQKAEEALKRAYSSLEKKVKERTAELEKTYNSMKESEKRLAEAQKMAHVGHWEWTIATDKSYWSDELYHIFGRNPQELAPSYNEYLSYVHLDEREYADTAHKEALKGKPFSMDHRIILSNGEVRTIHMKTEVIFNEKKVPIKLKGTVQDITERKIAEEKIQSLANIVESSNDAILTESLEGVITNWNKGAEHIFGYSGEEILGKNVTILEPDNLKGEINQFIGKITKGEKIKNYETLRLKKGGAIINVSLTYSPVFDSYGKLVAISAITRDITESKQAEEALRESEARLRQFYESNIIGVFYYNLDGLIIDANDKLLEIVGYTREDLYAGRVNWNKMTPPDYRLLDERAAEELKATGMNKPYEKEYTRKDGLRVPVIVGVASFDQTRNEGIAFVLDITERKKAEKSLANIEIARQKEIHHRIKNNLQVISSLLDLQADKFNNRECIKDSEILEAFRESQDRVFSIALIHEELYEGEETDALNFSLYIEKLAESLLHTYRLGNSDITLNSDIKKDVFFNMDIAVPLGMIVNELITNSLKYAFPDRRAGELQIKLFSEVARNNLDNKGEFSEKDTKYTLIVSDNGIGIPNEVNLENTGTLGLQLVTILVEQLDGEVKINRDKGTEFIISFSAEQKNN